MATPDFVPRPLAIASEWAWRLIVIGIVAGAILYAAAYLDVVVIPVAVAGIIAALLDPIRSRLTRHGLSGGAAGVIAFLIGVLLISGISALAVTEFYRNYDELAESTVDGTQRISDWIGDAPGGFDTSSIDVGVQNVLDRVKEDPASILNGTLSVLSTGGELIAGGLLCMLCTFFFMKDRNHMWNTTLKLFGQRSESVFDQAGRRAWHVVVSYTKVTLTSACVDATVIGAASAIVGLPVAVSLGVVVFLFAFIPTVGAILSGTIVVLVGLVVKGPAVALALAIVVLVVQQLDANLMYPMLTSRYLSLHPLTSLLLVGAGAVVGGIVGALFAVPLAAVCIAVVGTVNEARTQQPAIQEVA